MNITTRDLPSLLYMRLCLAALVGAMLIGILLPAPETAPVTGFEKFSRHEKVEVTEGAHWGCQGKVVAESSKAVKINVGHEIIEVPKHQVEPILRWFREG